MVRGFRTSALQLPEEGKTATMLMDGRMGAVTRE